VLQEGCLGRVIDQWMEEMFEEGIQSTVDPSYNVTALASPGIRYNEISVIAN
jgi:hypothetical protein